MVSWNTQIFIFGWVRQLSNGYFIMGIFTFSNADLKG